MEASQHSLLAACFTLHSINATLAVVPQRGAGLWGSEGTAPPFLTSEPDGDEWSASRPCLTTPVKESPAPTGQEAGWAPQPVWTMWRRGKSLAPARIRNPVTPQPSRYTDWLRIITWPLDEPISVEPIVHS
jgi:hypothetical protein